MLTNIPRLITAYYSEHPDTTDPTQRVRFGTSGHRGTSLNGSFNEPHVLAITQAICLYRRAHQIDGPLFLGWDTHAPSEPARVSALEVLAADHVDVMADVNDAATPTPVVSQAIVAYNRGRTSGLADGIVITPSHNPPDNGGIKCDPPTAGPAQSAITDWIEGAANQLLEVGMHDVIRIPWARARHEPTLHRFDFQQPYVDALPRVIDMDAVRNSGLHIGVDPLGGASLRYWDAISERFKLRVTVVNRMVDPTFRFVPVDHDGVIRMDPSSRYAMARLVDARQQFDLAFANDPDADRYGIVSRTIGLCSKLWWASSILSTGFSTGRLRLPAKKVRARHSSAVMARPGPPTRMVSSSAFSPPSRRPAQRASRASSTPISRPGSGRRFPRASTCLSARDNGTQWRR